jgi:hypothetical protein
VTKIPLACTLATGEAAARAHEWRAFLETHVVEVQRTSSIAHLRLRDESDSLLVATDLARREKACCAFFEFRLTILADAFWLDVEIPDDAGITLDDVSFFTAS